MEDRIVITSGPESRALTGLRGVGALLVLLHHFFLSPALHHHPPRLNGLVLKGYLGVDLFFVLSGFVMAMVYGAWFPAEAAGRMRRGGLFLVRRAARLWPLHAVVLGVIVGVALHAGEQPSPRTVMANFAMIQGWGISGEINVPAWSVSTEIIAYFLFPLLAGPLLRGRGGIWLGLAGIAVLLGAMLALAPPVGDARRGPLDIHYNYSVLPVLRCLAGFTLGMLTWRLGTIDAVRRAAASAVVGPLALALMLLVMLAKGHDLLIYPLLPLIVLGFHFGHGPAWRVLAAGPLHRLGVLSYAVYLVHYTLLGWLPFGWGPVWAELLAFLLATMGVAALAHLAVELPARRFIRTAGTAVLPRFGRAVPPPLQPGSG